jgi:hypothetical protein
MGIAIRHILLNEHGIDVNDSQYWRDFMIPISYNTIDIESRGE